MSAARDASRFDPSRYDGFSEEYPDEYDNDEHNDKDDWFDCHMGPGGYCGAAGSEYCEFECPYRARANA